MKTEAEILAWLQQTYVQSQDTRQKQMGLIYMTAETHDLARSIHAFIDKADADRIAVLEIQNARLVEEREKIETTLLDPHAVHINILAGKIARPSVESLHHIYGESALCSDQAQLIEERNTARDALANLTFDIEATQLARV